MHQVHDVHKYTDAHKRASPRAGRAPGTSLTRERLAIVGRLLHVGFPIDHGRLVRQYPLQIYFDGAHKSATCALTNGGTAIFIWARVVAVSRVTFDRFDLRRPDNTPLTVTWAGRCDMHEKYCVHDPKGGGWYADHLLSETLGIILRISPKKCMTFGEEYDGWVVGETQERLPPNILLAFIDKFGREFLFPFTVPPPS